MADATTWVPIARVSRREWPGEPLTNGQRREVRKRLEDGRLQARAVAYSKDDLEPSFAAHLAPSFWKKVTLLFTMGTSNTYRIEMNDVIRDRLTELFGDQGLLLKVEVNGRHLETMFDDFEKTAKSNQDQLVTDPAPATVPKAARIPTANLSEGRQRPVGDDVHLTSAQVRKRYGSISDMTLHRWLASGEMHFPRPAMINNRRYWSKASLDEWDAKKATGLAGST